nr:MAG TPA: hypothetical protein [Ackermannviridae sp.]
MHCDLGKTCSPLSFTQIHIYLMEAYSRFFL